MELFIAIDRWATKQCERQGITPEGEAKRRILGEDIVKAIRFPLMSHKEFSSVVFDSYILTIQEVGVMMKHYNGVLTSHLPFMQSSRGKLSGEKLDHFRCYRFARFFRPSHRYSNWWSYSSGKPDCINFTVNNPIWLCGVQHFGSEGGYYTVSTEVKDTTQDSSVVKQSGIYTSKKDETNNYYGFDVLFDRPVCLQANKQYTLVSLIRNGGASWYGKEGQTSVESEGVRFTFSPSNDSGNGTSVMEGQFPASIFSKVVVTVT